MDAIDKQLIRRLIFFKIKTENGTVLLRPGHLSSVYVPMPTSGMAEPLCFGRISFARPQGFFRSLPVVDVRKQNAPVQDSPIWTSQGKAAHFEPTVDTIEASQALLNVVGLAGLDCLHPYLDCVWKIVWMNHIAGVPIFQIFQRLAEVLKIQFVDGFDFPRWRHDCNGCRNAVD